MFQAITCRFSFELFIYYCAPKNVNCLFWNIMLHSLITWHRCTYIFVKWFKYAFCFLTKVNLYINVGTYCVFTIYLIELGNISDAPFYICVESYLHRFYAASAVRELRNLKDHDETQAVRNECKICLPDRIPVYLTKCNDSYWLLDTVVSSFYRAVSHGNHIP
jgi:hypothetical protein